MNSYKNIITIITVTAFIGFLMFVTVSMLTGGGNSIGNLFRYILPAFAIYGFTRPRQTIYMMFIMSPFWDEIKRFMIFDLRLTEFDLALILVVSPILMTAIFLRTFFDCVFTSTQENKKTLIAMIVTGLVVVAFITASVSIGGKTSGIRGIGLAVNAGIYFFLIPILPRYFQTRMEYAKLLGILTVVYMIPALWCIKQGIWGLSGFELDYVKYGLSGEIRQLNEKTFRNPGTMQGAAAMSCMASIFLALTLMPVIMKTGKFRLISLFYPKRIFLVLLFGMCMYYTYSRAPWFAIVTALICFTCLRVKFLSYLVLVSSIIGIFAIYLSAQKIFDEKLMNKWQVVLIKKYGGDKGVEQTLVLGTLNARFESMANLVNGRDHVWQPFGVKVAKLTGSNYAFNIKQHDMITEYVVKFGYIPCFFGFLFGIWIALKVIHLNFRLTPSPELNSARVYTSIFIGIQIIGFGHGVTLFTFPLNLFIAFFVASAIYHFKLARQIHKLATEEQPVNDPVASAQAPTSRFPSHRPYRTA
jgi:hypothetical protein